MIKKILGSIKHYFTRTDKCTLIWCKCGNELCSSDSFVSDTYDEKDENHVIYICTKCGRKHDYNFDIAPIPLSWREIRG